MHRHNGKRYPSHPNILYPFLDVTDPIVSNAFYRKFGATLKFDPDFLSLMG